MKSYSHDEIDRAESELRELIEVAEDVDNNVHKLNKSKVNFLISLVTFVSIASLAISLGYFYFESFNSSVASIAAFFSIILIITPIYFQYKSIIWDLRRETHVLMQLMELLDAQKKIIFSKSDDSHLNASLEVRIKRIDFSAAKYSHNL